MADPTSSLQQQSQSILTEKVARALQVRTETPAMKAALDALSHLHPTDTRSSSSSSSAFALSIDSRSVRVAIEQDALQQALRLQTELRTLVETVQNLRQGVSQVAAIAQRVREATEMPVITSETLTPMLPGGSSPDQTASDSATASAHVDLDDDHDVPVAVPTTIHKTDTAGSLEEEQKLASVLADSFLHRDLCRRRLEAIHAFLERFDLSQEDSRLLDHYAFEDVAVTAANENAEQNTLVNGLAFLNALERVRNIRLALSDTFGTPADNMAFLNPTSHNDTDFERRGLGASSALRMLDGLAQKQERAYERLYHWLQQYLQLFATASSIPASSSNKNVFEQTDGLDEALQHPFVRRSLYTLRHVPAFYTHTLELIASSRRAEETRRFLLALTSGYAGFPPIEMKAHDPVVYVGDMLAFAFKAFSTEADLARGLLQYTPYEITDDDEQKDDQDDDKQNLTAPDAAVAGGGGDAPISARDMLATSMSGLARPLKSRILQVVSNLARRTDDEEGESDDGLNDDFEEEGAGMRSRITHLYEISGFLLFYQSVIEKAIQKLDTDNETAATTTTAETATTAEPKDTNPLVACLIDCLRETTEAYEATARTYGAMLSQISSVTGETEANQAKSMLALIADVRLNSPGFSKDVHCPKECETVLSVEWVTVVLIDAALYCCVTLDDVMALKQSVSDIKKAGLAVVASEKLNESLDKKERELVKELVEKEKLKVLDLCGLAELAAAWRSWQAVKGDTLMVAYPGLSRQDVEAGMKNFYASLFSPPLPSLETVVKDPQLRKAARSEIADYIVDVYNSIHESIVSSGQGGYEDLSFLAHTPEQVKTLFSA